MKGVYPSGKCTVILDFFSLTGLINTGLSAAWGSKTTLGRVFSSSRAGFLPSRLRSVLRFIKSLLVGFYSTFLLAEGALLCFSLGTLSYI